MFIIIALPIGKSQGPKGFVFRDLECPDLKRFTSFKLFIKVASMLDLVAHDTCIVQEHSLEYKINMNKIHPPNII